MRHYYQLDGFFKITEEDVYAEGCVAAGSAYTVDFTIQDADINVLIEKAMRFCGCEDKKDVFLNSCDELGRLDIQVYEDEDGDSVQNLEAWKAGNERLWLCTYTARITLINEYDDINLIELVDSVNAYTIN